MIIYLLIKLSRAPRPTIICTLCAFVSSMREYYIIASSLYQLLLYVPENRLGSHPTQLGYPYTILASSPSTQNPPPPPSSSVSSSPSSPTTTPGTSRVAAG